MNAPSVLGIMAKYASAGEVKTRLGASIGMEKAARLHHVFLRHLADTLAPAASLRQVVLAPPQAIATARTELPRCWSLAPQAPGDLGRRMLGWFEHWLGGPNAPRRAGRAVLIGADCPLLTPADIHAACEALQTRDMVLGPAADGGYYLIGLSAACSDRWTDLFDDIPWSTEAVLESTLRRASRAGLRLSLLPQREDIDTVAELGRLRAQLSDRRVLPPIHRRLAEQIDSVLANDHATTDGQSR